MVCLPIQLTKSFCSNSGYLDAINLVKLVKYPRYKNRIRFGLILIEYREQKSL